MLICSGTVYLVIGVSPCSSAAAAVITLAVLPGGKIPATGRSTVSARLVTLPGWKVGYWARARILPVCGCMTTIVQLSALVTRIRWAQACWAAHCNGARMVSRTLPPGTMGRPLSEANGMGCPVTPVSTCCLPSRPASSELNDCSMPAWPLRSCAPLVLVKPTRPAARSPLG